MFGFFFEGWFLFKMKVIAQKNTVEELILLVDQGFVFLDWMTLIANTYCIQVM